MTKLKLYGGPGLLHGCVFWLVEDGALYVSLKVLLPWWWLKQPRLKRECYKYFGYDVNDREAAKRYWDAK